MNKSGKLRLIGKILSVLSIGFVVYAICKMGLDFSFVNNVPLFVLVVLAGIGMKLLSMWLSATAWTQWLSFFSRTPFEKRDARQVFLRANIGKYIPGNVMHFVQRNLFATDMGISQLQLAMSSVFEVMSYVAVALMVASLTAWDSMQTVLARYFGDRLPVLGIAAACVAVAIAAVLVILRKKIRTALAGYSGKQFLKTLLKVVVLQLVTLLLLAAVMVLLVWYAQGTLTPGIAGTVISTYVIAWVLGYIVPGASGGIGIREMALLLLLGPLLGEGLVLSLAMIHRLITIIGDFLGYLIVILQKRKDKGAEGHA
ncbi:MAG: hypothetical protein IKS46_05150 [Clostridia bacterium]|nr:hypothetical protein [Clostridia bacterium]